MMAFKEIDFEKHFYEFETFGFTIVKQVISNEEIQKVKQTIDKDLAREKEKYKDSPYVKPGHLMNLCECDPYFLHFLDNDIIHHFFAHFLDESCILYTYSTTINWPNERTGNHAIHVDSPRVIENYPTAVQITIALDDFTPENGASLYLPGSHTSTKVPSEETFERYAAQVTRKAGDAIFFNPRVFHRAADNNTDKPRYAFSMYAVRAFMKQRLDYTKSIDPALLPTLSERAKKMLGFDSRIPKDLSEFFVPADQRLYKANQG